MLFGDQNVTIAIILGMDDDPVFLALAGINSNLDFSLRVNANVENLAMSCKPGIRPPAIVTDSNWCDAVNDG